MAVKRYTYNVTETRKLKLEKLAIEASYKTGKPVAWTDLLETLIDEFSKDAQEMTIHREIKK